MGLLDDAIREHLELKRRRGADPGEVAREEAEALGPVRRGEVDLDDSPARGGQAIADIEDRSVATEEDELAFESEPVTRHHDDELEAEVDEVRHHGDPLGDAALGHEEPEAPTEQAEPELDLDQTPPHGDPLAHQATREFGADEVSEALGDDASDPDVVPADDGGEDVLEETPEFLQETPEHDRLWFEQKPPKDFDF